MPKLHTNNGKQQPAPRPKPLADTGVLAESLRLLALELPAVPVAGRKPTVSNWGEREPDAAELRQLLSSPGVGIALALHLTDLIDVECDSPEAEAALQELFGGEVPGTPTWQSKRGLHRLFKRPEGLPDKVKGRDRRHRVPHPQQARPHRDPPEHRGRSHP